MSFNPDLSKQTQEVIFSRKQAKSVYPDIVFKAMFFQENLWLQLFVRPHLDYGDLINQIIEVSVNKLRILNIMLPLQSLALLKEYLDLNYTMK